jgi:hypothetical protein
MRIPIITLSVLSTLSLLRAEPSLNMEPPEGPLLKRVPLPSQWTVTIQLAPPPGAADSGGTAAAKKKINPRVTTVIRSNNIVFEKTVNENGALIEIWRSGGWLAMNANSHGWIVAPNSQNTFNTTDYSTSDFSGFGWISLKNFSGRQNVNGQHCLVFKDKVITMDPQELEQMKSSLFLQYQAAKQSQSNLPPPVFNADEFKVDVEADIDEKTRLPVLLSYKTYEGLMTRHYDFQSADSSLSLPPEVKQLLQKYEENRRRLMGPMAPI